MLHTVTRVELDTHLTNSSGGIILIVFSVPYLGESRMLDEIVKEMAVEEDKQNISFVRIDVDREPSVTMEKGIYHIPTIMIYADLKLIYHKKGLQGKSQLKKALDKASSLLKKDVQLDTNT